MDYATEAGFVHLVEYSKSVTNVLFSRDYRKVLDRASKSVDAPRK